MQIPIETLFNISDKFALPFKMTSKTVMRPITVYNFAFLDISDVSRSQNYNSGLKFALIYYYNHLSISPCLQSLAAVFSLQL